MAPKKDKKGKQPNQKRKADEPNNPNNGKQNKGNQVVETRSKEKSRIAFNEDDERVELEVTAAQEREFIDSTEVHQNENNLAEINQSGRSNAEDDTNRNRPRRRDESDQEVGEISTSNNNSEGCDNRGKGKEMTDYDSDNDEEARSMMKFARFLEKQGFIRQVSLPVSPQREDHRSRSRENSRGRRPGNQLVHNQSIDSDSGTTIYRPALPIEEKRISTSSEEDQDVNSRVDMIVDQNERVTGEIVVNRQHEFEFEKQINQLQLSDYRDQRKERGDYRRERSMTRGDEQQPQPSTSYDRRRSVTPPGAVADRRSKEQLRRAENSKAKIYEVPGKDNAVITGGEAPNLHSAFSASDLLHSVLVDEGYSQVGKHLDDQICGNLLISGDCCPGTLSWLNKTTGWRFFLIMDSRVLGL